MGDVNDLPLPLLYERLTGDGHVRRLLALARDEDLGSIGDITSLTSVPVGAKATGRVVAREPGIIAGLATIPDLLATFAPGLRATTHARDGQPAATGQVIATLAGEKRELLAIERTALNILSRLSGIATLTARYVAAMHNGPEPIRARLYDTRKTTPGWRALEKYAVRVGGGHSHRLGLHDAVLIKDNHLAGIGQRDLADTVRRAAEAARAIRPDLLFVQVEVDSLDQLDRLLALPPHVVDIVLLDNMTLEQLREAVRRRDASASRPQLEASGGVRLDTIRDIALTGVDRISAGALTHQATSLDLALDLDA